MPIGPLVHLPTVTLPGQSNSFSDSASTAINKQEGGVDALAAGKTSVSSVAVTVSASLRELEQVSQGDLDADVDMDKVQAIRASIENGSYQINAEAIADKLLNHTQALLASERKA